MPIFAPNNRSNIRRHPYSIFGVGRNNNSHTPPHTKRPRRLAKDNELGQYDKSTPVGGARSE